MENKTYSKVMKYIPPIPTNQFPNIRMEVGIPIQEELICMNDYFDCDSKLWGVNLMIFLIRPGQVIMNRNVFFQQSTNSLEKTEDSYIIL